MMKLVHNKITQLSQVVIGTIMQIGQEYKYLEDRNLKGGHI